jgi:hypothetical protein
VAGLAADLIARSLWRRIGPRRCAQVVAATAPALLFGTYLLALATQGRLVEHAYLWVGVLMVTGAVGWVVGGFAPAPGAGSRAEASG